MGDEIDEVLADIPVLLRGQIRQVLTTLVRSGGEHFQQTSVDRGRTGQREISEILKNAGIGENDPRWRRVIEYGRKLYRSAP